jgi:hypothetical protein
LDSIQRTLPEEEKLSVYEYAISKVLLSFKQERKAIKESLKHNFPKAVFLYMPIFAFWLWLFHSKKKWLYFDHGIYTLHYFSLILLITLVYIIFNWLLSFFHTKIPDLVTLAIPAYLIYYFFHSHRLMYRESKTISRLICTALFVLNTAFVLVFLLLYVMVITLLSAE